MRNLILFFVVLCSAAIAGETAPTSFGVALTPKNYPKHNADDIHGMFETGKQVGRHAVFIYQWSDLTSAETARKMVALCAEQKMTPILGLSPTILGGNRGSLDVPQTVRAKVAGKVSLANETVRQSYIDAAVELTKLKPPYLCLATEINFLALADLPEYVAFAQVFKKLVPILKKISPETKFFVSFQYDIMMLMDEKEPGKVQEHAKLIDIFRPELDLLCITSYPYERHANPAEIPTDYYSKLLQYRSKDEEIMVMELGWPTTGKGSEKTQLEFVQRIPALMQKLSPKVVLWSLLHDVDGSGLSADLAHTGLLDNSGKPKAAFEALKKISNAQR